MALLWLFVAGSLAAQVSPAGSWRTLHSEHFRVHFRPGQGSIARHAIEEGERAYSLLSTELVPPRQSIDVVLSDAADFANGAASIFPSNRITLLLTPPTGEPELQNYDDWIRTVLVHELTHIFHLDRVKGPWRLIQALLGRVPGAFPNAYQPSWVTEGIAIWYESHLTGRGRIHGSFNSEVLLSLAAGDRWPRPSAASYISEKWPDGIAPYAFGSEFFGYLALAAGDSSIPRFIEKTSGQWIPFRTGRPLRLATGIRRDSLWYAQAAEYEARAHARPSTEAEIIARGLRWQPSPAVADDGSLAWSDTPLNEVGHIVIRRPDGREERHLATANVDLAWSGDTLYATRLDLTDPATYRSDLYRLANGKWERLTREMRLTDPSANPDGLVAVQLDESGNRLVRLIGGRLQPVMDWVAGADYASPAIDSVGRLVAVEHSGGGYLLRGFGRWDDPVLYRAGVNEVLADVTWDPAGYQLYFVSDRTGLPQIYRFTPDQLLEQVTDQPFGARQPALSRDGWLYFTSLESDGYALKRTQWRSVGQADRRTEGQADRGTGGQRDRGTPEGTSSRPEGRSVAGGRADSRTGGQADRGTGGQADSRTDDAAIDHGNHLSAPPPVRLSGYSPWSALRPHYFIPYLVDKGSAGHFLGAFTSGSDPVGRFSYAASAAAGFEGGFDASLNLNYRRWNHHTIDVYLAQDHGDAGVALVTPDTLPVRSRERDAEVGINTTWRRWYRSVTVRVAADYEQDRFTTDPNLDFINPEFAAASVGLALGRTLRPPLAISDEDGGTLSIRYRRRWRLDQDGWSDEWRGRAAIYKSIRGVGGFAHPVLAARVSAATSSGPDRETFGIGGASGITYQPLPGIVVGSSRAFPVRGFDGGEIRGGTVAVSTVELRLPLALVARPFGDLPYGLDRVGFRLFYDYGRAWDPPSADRPDWIHGAGVEVTWDLVVLYDVPLRLRTGVATALSDGFQTRQGDVRFDIGVGSEF